MPRRPISPRLWMCSALALAFILGGCTAGGQFDPTEVLSTDVFSTKKKLQGEREPLFPNGVPGVETGVPPDLIKGYQPPPDQAANADAAVTPGPAPMQTAPTPPAPGPAPKPKQKARAKPKPKPKPAMARTSPQPAIRHDPVWDQPGAAAPQAGSAQTNWPAPPQAGSAQTNWPPPPTGQAQQGQSIWPNPPAPAAPSH